MNDTISIDGREIGPERPTFVIAEIGVNHDGSAQRAIELVAIAKRCGADAVKLQVFRAATLMHASARFASYQKENCADADPAAMLRRYELCDGDVAHIVQTAREAGLVPLATPFSPPDVSVIERLGLPAIKIASPDLVNRMLLGRAIESGCPLLLSTGAAEMPEVAAACDYLRARRASFALLHCVSSYPATAEMAHLGWIGELRESFEAAVGYSDHTTEVASGALAVAAGAAIVEKHLTYDRHASGPDHAASADPAQFAEYVRLIRLAEAMRGQGPKRVLDCERDVRIVSRQSLVVARDVSAGEVLCRAHLTAQRPADGVCASQIDSVIGRVAIRSLKAGTKLQMEHLCDAA